MFSLLGIALIGHAAGIALALAGVAYRVVGARRAGSVVFVLTWLIHFGAIVQQGAVSQRIPLGNMSEFLLVLGWVVLSLYLYLWFALRIQVTGLVLPPVAGLATLAGWRSMIGATPSEPALTSPWFLFHVTVSTLGMAFLCVAFAMSSIYLVHDRALKSRKAMTMLERLPSLSKCDRVGLQALGVGFVLLTLGIGTGVAVNVTQQDPLWVASAKQLFPLLAWLLFAAVLIARSASGFRGRKAAYMTIAGFVLGLLTVLGMTL